jgi:biotin transport system substrate-specific component
MEDERNPTLPRILAALILGQIAIYALGITYLHLNLNYILHKPVSFQTVLQIGMLVFLPGDILKTAVAALVVAPIRHRLISAVHP